MKTLSSILNTEKQNKTKQSKNHNPQKQLS